MAVCGGSKTKNEWIKKKTGNIEKVARWTELCMYMHAHTHIMHVFMYIYIHTYVATGCDKTTARLEMWVGKFKADKGDEWLAAHFKSTIAPQGWRNKK